MKTICKIIFILFFIIAASFFFYFKTLSAPSIPEKVLIKFSEGGGCLTFRQREFTLHKEGNYINLWATGNMEPISCISGVCYPLIGKMTAQEFDDFWNKLNMLNFMGLKEQYIMEAEHTGWMSGEISLHYYDGNKVVFKEVRFTEGVQDAAFREIYLHFMSLSGSMLEVDERSKKVFDTLAEHLASPCPERVAYCTKIAIDNSYPSIVRNACLKELVYHLAGTALPLDAATKLMDEFFSGNRELDFSLIVDNSGWKIGSATYINGRLKHAGFFAPYLENITNIISDGMSSFKDKTVAVDMLYKLNDYESIPLLKKAVEDSLPYCLNRDYLDDVFQFIAVAFKMIEQEGKDAVPFFKSIKAKSSSPLLNEWAEQSVKTIHYRIDQTIAGSH